MKKTILILATAAFAFGMNSCKKSDTTTTPTVVAPVASYSYSPTTVLAGTSTQFTDNSTNNPTTWAWDFGDGGIPGTTKSVAHTYGTSGTFNVTLSVSNSAGSNTITKQVVVQTLGQQYAGTYNATETDTYNGGFYNSTYVTHISGSTTNPNGIVFSNFNNGQGSNFNATIAGNSVTLSSSDYINGVYQALGTGTISGNTITINWNYSDNNSNHYAYTTVFVKQ